MTEHAQPHPTADTPSKRREQAEAVPEDADPRRLHTDPEFDEDEPPEREPIPPGDII